MGVWTPGPGPTDGNDVFEGAPEREEAFAGRGNDTLRGAGGNDALDGGEGLDWLIGGEGDDLLLHGVASGRLSLQDEAPDRLEGGLGNDELSGGDHDTLLGGEGDDRISVGLNPLARERAGGDIVVDGGPGSDRIAVRSATGLILTGSGADRIAIEDPHPFPVPGLAAMPRYIGSTAVVADFTLEGPDADRVELTRERPLAIWQSGTDTELVFRDLTIVLRNVDRGGLDARHFLGVQYSPPPLGPEAGDNVLTGGAEDDVLIGAEGDDVASGGAGNDYLLGGPGADTLTGGAGLDTLRGGSGDDQLSFGGAGDESPGQRLYGEGGRDTLSGGAGDLLHGGDGDDLLIRELGPEGAATLRGGRGADTLTGGAGVDVFAFQEGDSTPEAFDRIVGFEPGVDSLDLHDLGATRISIVRLPGREVMVFAEGQYGRVAVHVDALLEPRHLGQAQYVGLDDANDTVTGGSSGDSLFGLGGDDVLVGGVASAGGSDHGDYLFGDAGADTLTGGPGNDRFAYRNVNDSGGSGGFDTITDFAIGEDLIDLYYLRPTAVSLNRVDGATLIFAQAAGGQLVVGVNAALNAQDVGFNGGVDIVGEARSETLIGWSSDDRLFGLGGNDRLEGGAGADQLFGDAGGDLLMGGAGADRFAYRAVADSNAADGYDIIADFATGEGDKIDLFYLNGVQSVSINRLNGGTFIFAGTAAGQLQVGLTTAVQGTDLVAPFGASASFGYDMVGEGAGERLVGSGGNDRLFGLGGSDILEGGAGDDQLFGDGGRDNLVGGAGADRFSYRGVGDSVVGAADVVFDFQLGVDKIDLSLVRTGAADRIGWAVKDGDTFVFVDLGGDGTLDLEIALKGVVGLQASDFVP